MRAFALLCLVLVGCGDEPTRRTPLVASNAEELRPTDTSSTLMWRYQAGDVVASFGVADGGFRTHFTRAGVNAVPLADADDSGVPDFVEQVDATYEAVGALYHGPLAYRRPLSDATVNPNGGDARFDVYLLDFARAADGAFRVDLCPSGDRCVGYVVQENDFAGYGYPSAIEATRILGSHEYFHAVQAAYDNDQNVVVSEGTAVWATERFDPATNDFERFIDGYLNRPDRSIDSPPPGPVPDFAYGSAIFFKFLTERHDDALIRKLWEKLENGQGDPTEPADQANPTWVIQLDALLKRDYQSSFAAEFAEFAKWNLFLGAAADSTQAYDSAGTWPTVALTNVTAPHRAEGLRVFYASAQYFTAAAGSRTRMTAALVDSPLTTTDDLEGAVLWIAARKGARNTEVVRVTAGQTVEVTGGVLIAAVVNTNRGPNGASRSSRPSLCLGSPEEVSSCVAALGGSPADAGVDAGIEDPPDAGVPDAGVVTEPPPPPTGCGCGITPPSSAFFALALAWAARRRRR
jgi:MYXO-CTERM domain-containing protein